MDSLPSGLAKNLHVPKFRIQQSIPSDSVKKGPYAIVRSAALNDSINILRRFVTSEGSKPIFERDDITVNQTSVGHLNENTCSYDPKDGCKAKQNRRSLSTDSSSPERYRHRDSKKHFSPPIARCSSSERSSRNERADQGHRKHTESTKYNSYAKNERSKRREKSKSRTLSPPRKKKTTEKLPYYRDELRERDRLRRLYGRSRSRSPTSSRKYSPVSRRRFDSPARRRRSSSRDKTRRHLTYHRSRGEHKSRRSRTRSKSRSPSRRDHERHKQKKDSNTLPTTVMAPTPQIIPIAVPVPADYGYGFQGWPVPQPTWHTPRNRPPTFPHFASIPMLPMMPPLRSAQSPFAGIPPMTSAYRPHTSQRCPTPRPNNYNYQVRPKKPST